MTQREIIGKTPKISKLAIALAIAGLMVIGGFVALASSHPTATSPPASAAATSQNILPNPVMNSNITWSTFYNGWNPLEYSTGSTNETLNTDFSSTYNNPISVNPADIQGIAPTYAAAGANTSWNPAVGKALATGTVQSLNNASGHETMSINGSNAGSSLEAYSMHIPITALPSNNAQYDYFTLIYSTTGKTITGEKTAIYLTNDTNHGSYYDPAYFTQYTYGTTTQFTSIQLSTLTSNTTKYGDMNTSNNNYYTLGLYIYVPSGTSGNTWSITLNAFMLTTNPIYLGSNATATQITSGIGNIHLSTLNPDFTWKDITNAGYTVATSQPMQNVTTTQTAINSNGYSEQATYQGTEYLPTAPDLTYTVSNISMPMNVSGAQYTIANLNGVSYLSAIQAKHNGTFLFASVNPNQQNSIILQLDYTTSQWNSVSGAPPFFSLAGLEYYWWVGLIGFFSLIGLGSAALAHWGGAEENLRTPKGKFGR